MKVRPQTRANPVTVPAEGAPPWSQDDLEQLQPQERALVNYMWEHREANLADVCPAVWLESDNLLGKRLWPAIFPC